MTKITGKKKIAALCPECKKEIDWVWILKYESEGFKRDLYLCKECENVIKILK
jgi:hypothetical protein